MMNIPEAIHCIGCGLELGLMPIPAESIGNCPCPRCRTAQLDAFSSDGGAVLDCSHCGGQFVATDVLAKMIARHENRSFDLPRRLRPSNPLVDSVTYLPCPFCRELMIRRNFGRTSGIIVDVCSIHGTWFDAGELPRILTFVNHGGFTLPQASDLAPKDAILTPYPNAVPRAHGFDVGHDLDSSAHTLNLREMEEAAAAFVHWVREMLR